MFSATERAGEHMADTDYDVVVIGSGPGGEGAAMKARKAGLRVAVVERYRAVGGGCTHWGTIPSKALRHAIGAFGDLRKHPMLQDARLATPDFPQLLRTASDVIRRQVDLRTTFYERNHVPVLTGHARFKGPHALDIHLDGGGVETITSRAFVVAVGSRPYRPDHVDFNHPRILDADKVLSLRETPQTLTIYGAGVIGSEYASMFRNLGIKVTLINTRDRLLSFLDDEIVDALAYHLRDQGILIKHNELMTGIEGRDHDVVLQLASGKQIRSDYLLFAEGRTGNTQDLGLDNVGLVSNSRGHLKVNDNYQTEVESIYAVGDVIGYPSLASAAYDQGRFAATHIAEGSCPKRLVQLVPTGIYTSPEISSVGRTERELTDARVPYEVGQAQFRHLARAQIAGETVGMLKLLFHRDTLEVLGIHCFGARASEIVHIGQAVMAQGPGANTLEYFTMTTFNYPTMAEAYRVAALNGLNRLF
jgi:NAD(P) transhydrogenase